MRNTFTETKKLTKILNSQAKRTKRIPFKVFQAYLVNSNTQKVA